MNHLYLREKMILKRSKFYLVLWEYEASISKLNKIWHWLNMNAKYVRIKKN